MEAELHKRSVAGDAGAWRELIRRHSPAIYRLALRMLRSPVEAEDASQDVFARMYGSFGSYDPARPMGPWVSKPLPVVHVGAWNCQSRTETSFPIM